MKLINANIAGAIIYVSIPFTYFLDWAFFETKISVIELVGMGVIVLSNVALAIYKGCYQIQSHKI